LLQKKKEDKFNKWFEGVFHSNNKFKTLETPVTGAEISWKNLKKVKSVKFPKGK